MLGCGVGSDSIVVARLLLLGLKLRENQTSDLVLVQLDFDLLDPNLGCPLAQLLHQPARGQSCTHGRRNAQEDRDEVDSLTRTTGLARRLPGPFPRLPQPQAQPPALPAQGTHAGAGAARAAGSRGATPARAGRGGGYGASGLEFSRGPGSPGDW